MITLFHRFPPSSIRASETMHSTRPRAEIDVVFCVRSRPRTDERQRHPWLRAAAAWPRRRPAFTLVELLVVIAILAMLMALLFPAIQAARETVSQTRCANNLRQYGVGLTSHLTLRGGFPDNGGKGWFSITSGPGSFMIKLLPYMEQAALFDQIVKDRDLLAVDVYSVFAGDPKFKSLVLSVMRCPSSRFPQLNPFGEAVTDYAPSSGSQSTNTPFCNQYPGNRWGTGPLTDSNNPSDLSQLSGLFARVNGHGVIVTASDVPDGMSNTIAIGEVRPDCSVHNAYVPWWNNQRCIVTTSIPLNFPTCPAEAPGNDGQSVRNCNSFDNWSTEVGFKSPHAQKVGFVFADGSVRFLSELIDFDNYQRLGCRREGTEQGQVLQGL